MPLAILVAGLETTAFENDRVWREKAEGSRAVSARQRRVIPRYDVGHRRGVDVGRRTLAFGDLKRIWHLPEIVGVSDPDKHQQRDGDACRQRWCAKRAGHVRRSPVLVSEADIALAGENAT